MAEPTRRRRVEGLVEGLLERRESAVAYTRDRVPGGNAMLEALERERDSGGGLIAGGIAYRFFLWLLPFGLTVAAALGLWASRDAQGVEDAAREFGMGAVAASSVASELSGSAQSRWALLVIGLVFTSWFSVGAVRALRLASSLAWQLKPTKVPKPAVAVLAYNALFLANYAGAAVLAWLRHALSFGPILGAVTLVCVPTAVAYVAFRSLPRRSDDWRDHLAGALVVGIGTQLVQIAVILYFAPKLESSSELYGTLGVAATLLLWLYVLGRLVTIALFLNATLWERRVTGAASTRPA